MAKELIRLGFDPTAADAFGMRPLDLLTARIRDASADLAHSLRNADPLIEAVFGYPHVIQRETVRAQDEATFAALLDSSDPFHQPAPPSAAIGAESSPMTLAPSTMLHVTETVATTRLADAAIPPVLNPFAVTITDPSDHALAALSRPFPPRILKALLINGAGVGDASAYFTAMMKGPADHLRLLLTSGLCPSASVVLPIIDTAYKPAPTNSPDTFTAFRDAMGECAFAQTEAWRIASVDDWPVVAAYAAHPSPTTSNKLLHRAVQKLVFFSAPKISTSFFAKKWEN